MKVRAILNPRAGLKAQRALRVLEREHPAWGALQIALTERPGHARELAEEAVRERADLLLAVGGDGTVNEVARGLIGSGAALGTVPVDDGDAEPPRQIAHLTIGGEIGRPRLPRHRNARDAQRHPRPQRVETSFGQRVAGIGIGDDTHGMAALRLLGGEIEHVPEQPADRRA